MPINDPRRFKLALPRGGAKCCLILMISAGCASPTAVSRVRIGEPARTDHGLLSEETHRIEAFRRACPSVVQVSALRIRRDPARFNILEIPYGLGTGIVWDREGHIVTNAHVIGEADELRVVFKSGASWIARVVDIDPNQDIALLEIDASELSLTPVELGTSADLRVGQTVLAVGNPFGFDHSLSVGVVSALGREIQSDSGPALHGLIQTDAAINPGNSGGPLLDGGGKLVGINTALVSPSGAFAGIGFAVPVDRVREAIAQFLALRPAERLGIGIRAADDGWARELGLSGVLVLELLPGGPAELAGLRPTRTDADGNLELGDLIIAVEEQVVRTRADLARALDGRAAGEEVALTLRRGTTEDSLRVRLAQEGH